MKKHIWLILVILLSSFLLLQGCSGNSGSADDETEINDGETENNGGENDEEPLSEIEENIEENNEVSGDIEEESEKYYLDDFSLTLMDGKETSLYAYEGQTIMLNFWASWCTYCRQIMPLLDEFNAEQDDVIVLAINVGESRETIENYIDEHGYDLKFFIDEESRISRQLGVSGLPTTVFIGPDFEYYTVLPGLMTEETLNQIWEIILDYQEENK